MLAFKNGWNKIFWFRIQTEFIYAEPPMSTMTILYHMRRFGAMISPLFWFEMIELASKCLHAVSGGSTLYGISLSFSIRFILDQTR